MEKKGTYEETVSESCGRPPSERLPRNHSSEPRDSVLIERILAGDDRAFERLLERYAPMVLGYLCGKIGSDSDREDLLQEVFFAAYCRIASLRDRDRFGPWLMRITRNKLFDFCRERSARTPIASLEGYPGTVDSSPVTQRADLSPGPMDKASLAETQNLVMDAIGKMDERYRTVLFMRLIAEETPQAIARGLGLKSSTVRMRLLRGLKKLRKALQNEGLVPPRAGGIVR